MKFQPTLRDFLWLTLVAALLVRWFFDHRELSAKVSRNDWKRTSEGVIQASPDVMWAIGGGPVKPALD